jgi:hypothetical protein
MASTDTLRLAHSLNRRGFNVWTPTVRKAGRMPRTRVEFDKEFPLLPSYAFARVDDLEGLAKAALLQAAGEPRFSLFRYQGGFPLIDDMQLGALRLEEGRLNAIYERQKRKGVKGPALTKGERVNLPEGGFAGLVGTVEEQSGGFTLVNVEGFNQPIRIASILLATEVKALAA